MEAETSFVIMFIAPDMLVVVQLTHLLYTAPDPCRHALHDAMLMVGSNSETLWHWHGQVAYPIECPSHHSANQMKYT